MEEWRSKGKKKERLYDIIERLRWKRKRERDE